MTNEPVPLLRRSRRCPNTSDGRSIPQENCCKDSMQGFRSPIHPLTQSPLGSVGLPISLCILQAALQILIRNTLVLAK